MNGQARLGEDRGQPRERVTALGHRLEQRLAQPLDQVTLGIGAGAGRNCRQLADHPLQPLDLEIERLIGRFPSFFIKHKAKTTI